MASIRFSASAAVPTSEKSSRIFFFRALLLSRLVEELAITVKSMPPDLARIASRSGMFEHSAACSTRISQFRHFVLSSPW